MPSQPNGVSGIRSPVHMPTGVFAEDQTLTPNDAAPRGRSAPDNGPNGRPPLSDVLPANMAQAASQMPAQTFDEAMQQIEALQQEMRPLRGDLTQALTNIISSEKASTTKIKQQQAKIDALQNQVAQLKESPNDRRSDSPGNKKIIAQEIKNIGRGFGSAAAATMMVVGGVSMIGLAILGGPVGMVLSAGLVASVGYLAVHYFLSQDKKENEAALRPPNRREPTEPANTAARINAANSPRDEGLKEDDEDDEDGYEDQDQHQAANARPSNVTSPITPQSSQPEAETRRTTEPARQANTQGATNSASNTAHTSVQPEGTTASPPAAAAAMPASPPTQHASVA